MRVLLITSRYPFPALRGDQLRTVQAVRALAAEHEVTVLAPQPPAGAPAPPPEPAAPRVRWELYRPAGRLGRLPGLAAAAVSGRPFQTGLFRSRRLAAAVRRHGSEADLAILQLVRLAPYRPLLGETPVLVDLIDSLALSTARRARFDRPWLAPALRLEARRLGRWERRLAEGADLTLLVSERDRRAVLASARGPAVTGRLERSVRVLPVAVAGAPAENSHRPDRPVLAVTGNLGYFPTREGLRWLLAEIWPRLRADRPDLRLVVAGSRPPRWLGRHAARTGAELVVDPPDLAATLAGATIALAPMRCGAGQPLKVLEAWAAGVPVVTTPWTAAGTSGRPDRELVVADGARQWVDAIRRLLDDPARRRRLADAARARLAADYSPESVRAAWSEAVRAAIAEASSSPGSSAARSDARAARSRA